MMSEIVEKINDLEEQKKILQLKLKVALQKAQELKDENNELWDRITYLRKENDMLVADTKTQREIIDVLQKPFIPAQFNSNYEQVIWN